MHSVEPSQTDSLAFQPSTSSAFSKQVYIDGPSTQYVKLNVGGEIFQTTLGTLVKYDSMFRTMFQGQVPVLQDEAGFVLIDRCGKHFGTILNFLRQGNVPLPTCRTAIEEILCEAKYYLLQELVAYCEDYVKRLNQLQCEPAGIPRVPVVNCKRDVEMILQNNADRPAIELLMNRQNNKYSYTHQADENFLRNQELFDKLVLRFNNRVLFIKNVGIGSSEICQWIFYANGQKKIEICCTSIVYATDRKQTKVEFPEARIYEEAMNALLSSDPESIRLCSRCRTTVPLCESSSSSPDYAPTNLVEPLCTTLRQSLAVEQLNNAKANFSRIDWRTDHHSGTMSSTYPSCSHEYSFHANGHANSQASCSHSHGDPRLAPPRSAPADVAHRNSHDSHINDD